MKIKTIIRYAKLIEIVLIAVGVIIVLHLTLLVSPYKGLRDFLECPVSTRYYDRNGNLLQVVPLQDGLRREYYPLQDIPAQLAAIFIQAEDSRFYYHGGVDVFSIIRAAFQNVNNTRNVSGASTITMQLARIIEMRANTSTSTAGGSGKREAFGARGAVPPHNLLRKIGEAINALRLEARFSKKQILQMYLNNLPFGYQSEGVGSAAHNFFGTSLNELSGAQMFCLAVIPRRPSTYNPFDGAEANKSAALQLCKTFSANKRLYKKYTALQNISEDDFDEALRLAKRFEYPFQMPHLIRYYETVLNKKTYKNAAVTLSADIYLQKYLEDLIAYNVSYNRGKRITNGAAIVIDNASGDVLAWVGSADFFNAGDNGQVDGVIALNQPGSSMKPFLYGLALQTGFAPTTVLADVPMSFGSSEIYVPQNFNNQFNGPLLFRYALASSLNIPAVYLLYNVHQKTYSSFLINALDFKSLENGNADDAGLGLALGNAPVSLVELSRAFSVFPNGGKLLSLNFETTDSPSLSGGGRNLDKSFGKRRASSAAKKKKVFDADTAAILCSFLSDEDARYLGFGRSATFRTGFPAIFKTGTANQYQSIVALGATPNWTAGVWMGNFSGETVLGKTGSSIPAAVVRDALKYLHRETDPNLIKNNFEEPLSFAKEKVCAVSGMAPNEYCSVTVLEYVKGQSSIQNGKKVFYPNVMPVCNWHYEKDGIIQTVYPSEYEAWLKNSRYAGSIDHSGAPLSILNPRNGFIYYFDNSESIIEQVVPLEVIGGSSDELTIYYDEKVFTINRPFNFYLPLERGDHKITTVCADEVQDVYYTVE
ncbi:MAG: penicillin-binding protein 1C [Termitinemataceae bacterium]|nr:MAG: penicillin-binding protein 1C [Termitinemataceae bacterium]